jgi:hypothetical protein
VKPIDNHAAWVYNKHIKIKGEHVP